MPSTDKGAGILALLGTPKGEPGGVEDESAESDEPSQQAAEDAAAAFFAAGKSGDWAGAVDAYKDLKKACEALKSSEGTETEEEY